jgi:hypothetical protein
LLICEIGFSISSGVSIRVGLFLFNSGVSSVKGF